MARKSIKAFCTISVVVFLILELAQVELMDAISYAISAGVLADLAYDRLLWRFNPFEKTPKLYGVYHASLHSTYNEGTHHTGKVTIRQTLSSITILEESEGGYCESVTATLSQSNPDGPWMVYYTYLTHPKSTTKHDDMHYGSCILFVKHRDLLEGNYYTNRKNQTAGDIKLERWA